MLARPGGEANTVDVELWLRALGLDPYAQAFADTEPLSWFQRQPDGPVAAPAAVALEEAQRVFSTGDMV